MITFARPHHLEGFIRNMRPRRLRTMREFAEQEIVLPDGPYKGDLYRADVMPWHVLVLDLIESRTFPRIFATGPRQDSKTLLFSLIPLMYYAFEHEEDIIVGVPSAAFAQELWEERIKPIIKESNFKELLPKTGPGSRDGKIQDYVRFENGVNVKFVSEGFSDTARIILFIEVYRMKQKGTKGEEAGAFYSIEECASTFKDDKVVFGECITTDGTGHIPTEIKAGTDTHIIIPCGHCGNYVLPERDQVINWSDQDNVIKAGRKVRYQCQVCENLWDEKDLLESNHSPKLLHKGQKITKGGRIMGPDPEEYTDTLGIQWGRLHSTIHTLPGIGQSEWRAEYNPPPEWKDNPEKSICNYVYGIAFKENLDDLPQMTQDIVLNKISKYQKRQVPKHAEKVVTFIDPGQYICWWTTWAFWGHRIGLQVEYGQFEVPQEMAHLDNAIIAALKEFDREVLQTGWIKEDQMVPPDMTFIDASYETKAVYRFILDTDPKQTRYRAAMGDGTSDRNRWVTPKKHPKANLRGWYTELQPNGIKLVHMNSDRWKEEVHKGFRVTEHGAEGSLVLHNVKRPREHISFARQIAAEEKVKEINSKGKEVVRWDRGSRKNHYFDCTYGSLVAAEMLGIRLAPAKKKTQTTSSTAPQETGRKREIYQVGR